LKYFCFGLGITSLDISSLAISQIDARWRNQDRMMLHCLRISNIWEKSQGNDCGKKSLGSGVPHTTPTTT
jgi:hypothetical protein